MTELTRRSFFRLTAGAALIPIAAKVAALSPAYYLYGDGIHDDTEALHALINGDIVEFSDLLDATGMGWRGRELLLPHAKYLLHTPLTFAGADMLYREDVAYNLNFSTFYHAHFGPRILIAYAERCVIKNSIHHPVPGFEGEGVFPDTKAGIYYNIDGSLSEYQPWLKDPKLIGF